MYYKTLKCDVFICDIVVAYSIKAAMLVNEKPEHPYTKRKQKNQRPNPKANTGRGKNGTGRSTIGRREWTLKVWHN